MPFPNNTYSFNEATLKTVNEVGAIYGLFSPIINRPGYYTCLYVGTNQQSKDSSLRASKQSPDCRCHTFLCGTKF